MGNESSVEMEGGTLIQSQGEEHLWSLHLHRESEIEGEGVCVFSRKPTKGAQTELCRAGIEHLRLLRHPNIIKFLGVELSHELMCLITEPLVPVSRVLEGISIEGAVMGWRGVGEGLNFLHSKAEMSHNNICVKSIYVNVLDSHWKLGGFEAASRHKTINSTFLSAVSSIRSPKAIPPEDKLSTVAATPPHSRDMWGFGHFILTIVEDAQLEGQLTDSSYQYINDEILNPDPHLRPPLSEIFTQPWMSNQASQITDFLSNLTLKTKSEKDRFFQGLAKKLHSVPPTVIAEHIVPLLITPLVMTEPLARESLWKHLLLPVGPKTPRLKAFDSSITCPLLDQELYISHVIPLILNLLESRDCHVRLILLAYVGSFAPLCDQEDLEGVVLPEVLLGLKETRDDVVQATLHALGDLVPLLGADAVMGTSRKQVFTDAQPRAHVLNEEGMTKTNRSSVPAKGPPSARKNTPPPSLVRQSREDRLSAMKKKREEQRLKKMAQNKLGHVTTSTVILDNGDSDSEAVLQAPPTNSSPQYSPSISHDEVELEGLGGSGTSVTGSEGVAASSAKVTQESRKGSTGWEGFKEDDDDDDDDDWGENWSDIEADQQEKQVFDSSANQIPEKPPKSSRLGSSGSGGGKTSKLVLKSIKSPPNKDNPKSPPNKDSPTDALKGRLKVEDIQRLEQQSMWSKGEPDLFADMAPKIATSPSLHTSPTQPTTNGSLGVSKSFQYQPQENNSSGDWGNDDWTEDF